MIRNFCPSPRLPYALRASAAARGAPETNFQINLAGDEGLACASVGMISAACARGFQPQF